MSQTCILWLINKIDKICKATGENRLIMAKNSLKNVIWYLIAPLTLISLLILPNNFSTSALVFLNGLALMYVAKIRVKYILFIILCALLFFLSIYSKTYSYGLNLNHLL